MGRNKYQTKKKSNLFLIPVILMMGFIPIIVHKYLYDPNLSQFEWFPANADSRTDFFFVWKMIAIIIVGLVMIGILLYQFYIKKKQLKFENSFYVLGIYALFVIMSALFSSYKYWVIHGTYEIFEPIWIIFSYMVVCYYTYQFVDEEQQVYTVLRWSGIGMIAVTLIGVFQYFGIDFFKTSLGKHLITNPSNWNQLDNLQFSFGEKISYTTLYNPNFLSFYFGMLIALMICLFIATKKIWHRILLVICEILCIICLVGSDSMTGWMALGIGFVVCALVLLSRNKKSFIIGISVVAIGIITSLILVNMTSVGKIIKDNVIGTSYISDRFALTNIETNDDDFVLEIHGNKLCVSYSIEDDGQVLINCTDTDGQVLSQTMVDADNQIVIIDDPRFAEVQLQPVSFGDDMFGICATIDGVQWNFLNTTENGYVYLSPAGKLIKYPKTKCSKLFLDDAMSNRGYIWNKTIPLLGKHIFMGSGANTYMFEMPQEDYISQNYVYGANAYDVKAHNWYLQQWVENGLIGTLALIIFLFLYIVQSVRIYRRVDLHNSISWVGFGLFASAIVYLLAAIVNDSNVCTAPVFWSLLGLGMAVNRMLINRENLSLKDMIASTTVTDSDSSTQMLETDTKNNRDIAKVDPTHAKPQRPSNKKQSRKQRKRNK